MAEKRIETVEMRAGDVKTGFGNPRKITKKKKDELRNSIETFGDFGSFIIDENDNIIGGNMRLSVIKEMDPDTIILCKRLIGYSETELRAINIKDNTHSGDWDEFGGGDARRAALGNRYDEVQDAINHIHNASAQELADEVWTGKYGDDEVRKTVLGDRWQEVQDIVNGGGKKYHTIESGETLTSIAKNFGTTVDALIALNDIKNPNLIIAGDSIRVR